MSPSFLGIKTIIRLQSLIVLEIKCRRTMSTSDKSVCFFAETSQFCEGFSKSSTCFGLSLLKLSRGGFRERRRDWFYQELHWHCVSLSVEEQLERVMGHSDNKEENFRYFWNFHFWMLTRNSARRFHLRRVLSNKFRCFHSPGAERIAQIENNLVEGIWKAA